MPKGTVRTNFANVKTVDRSALPEPLAMQIGDWVYGTLSVTGSDIMNFDHFFRKDGSRVPLPKLCKATVGNMTIDQLAVENPDPTEPPVDPPVEPPVDPKGLKELMYIDTTFKSYDGSVIVIRTVPITPQP